MHRVLAQTHERTADVSRTARLEPERRPPRRHLRFHAVRGRLGPRFAIALLGIAISTVLAVVLMASDRGVTSDIRAYIAQPGADLWVAPRGVDNFIRSAGLITSPTVADIPRTKGVASAQSLLRAFVTVKPRESADASMPRGLNLMAVGYASEQRLGGPPRLVAGRPPHGDAEMAVDRAAASRLRLGIGSTALVNDMPMTVVGITGGTNLIATQFAFFDLAAVEATSGYLSGMASFVVVDVADGTDVESVRQELEASHPDISAHRVQSFLQNNVEEAMAGFRPFERLVTVVGLLAAAALVAMLIQSIVEDRKSELAILLAMGASLGSVVLALFAVALRTAALGVLTGILLVVALTALTNRWVPTITVAARWTDGVLALAVFAFVSLVGAMLPALRLRYIDPVEAFRP